MNSQKSSWLGIIKFNRTLHSSLEKKGLCTVIENKEEKGKKKVVGTFLSI